jgi:hypothetical protein
MENIHFPGQIFYWKKNNPSTQSHVKTYYTMTKEEKEEKEDTDKPKFPPNYQKVSKGECQLHESKALEWMDTEVKTKQFYISIDD